MAEIYRFVLRHLKRTAVNKKGSRKQESEGQAVTNQENSSITLPKNIRQIGTFGDKYRIYIEDFAYTYVHRFIHQRKREDTVLAAVLLGESRVSEDQEYVFISAAQKVDFEMQEPERRENEPTSNGRTDAQEEFWDRVYQRIKNSFDDLDILGWYFNLDGSGLEVPPQLQQFFETTYKKGSRLLYFDDSIEQTDAFFVQEQHRLQRLSGYAVYYEKNPQMQQFMAEEKERMMPKPLRESYLSEEQGDDVVQNYRAIMNKLSEKPKKRRVQPFVYAAGAAVLVIVAATAVTQIGNYQNLQVLQETMQALSGSADDEDALSSGEDSGTEEVTETAAADAADGDADTPAGDSSDGSDDSGGTSGSGGGSSGSSSSSTDSGTSGSSTSGSGSGTSGSGSSDSTGSSTESSVQTASSSGSTSASGSTSGYYTVQAGDSLLSISQSVYNTTSMVEEICALNGIEDMDRIYVGQTLQLP
ncbi:MAG: LysM peptidoglycan-binding domain-containing protein [Lachnospiraceae bacterium]|nr:LysM peptidoglycan-binding domain-containing protein [Lachnospiraceae bacterium]